MKIHTRQQMYADSMSAYNDFNLTSHLHFASEWVDAATFSVPHYLLMSN